MHYSKAPVIEAAIDISVYPSGSGTNENLQKLREAIKQEYPESQQILEQKFIFQQDQQYSSSHHTVNPTGLRLINVEQHKVANVRIDGCGLSILHPYNHWEVFRDEARQLWDLYRNILEPHNPTRLAVRYINRLDIPDVSIKLEEYLRTVPQISPDMPQILQRYFMQLTVPMVEIHAIAVINQAIVPPPEEGMTSIMLDIDLSREEKLPEDEQSIWSIFEELRIGKNEIFESCVTSKYKELIA